MSDIETDRKKRPAIPLIAISLIMIVVGYFLLIGNDYHHHYPAPGVDIASVKTLSAVKEMRLRYYGDFVRIEEKDWGPIFESLKSMEYKEKTCANPSFYYMLELVVDGNKSVFMGVYEANYDEFVIINANKGYINDTIYPLIAPYEKQIQERFFSTQKDRDDRSVFSTPRIRLFGGSNG